MGGVGADDRIMSGWLSKGVKAWTGFFWPNIWTDCGYL